MKNRYALIENTPMGVVPESLDPEDAWNAVKQMEKEGGGFARAIADAYYRADNDNQQRLLAAFGPLFRSYKAKHDLDSGSVAKSAFPFD